MCKLSRSKSRVRFVPIIPTFRSMRWASKKKKSLFWRSSFGVFTWYRKLHSVLFFHCWKVKRSLDPRFYFINKLKEFYKKISVTSPSLSHQFSSLWLLTFFFEIFQRPGAAGGKGRLCHVPGKLYCRRWRHRAVTSWKRKHLPTHQRSVFHLRLGKSQTDKVANV